MAIREGVWDCPYCGAKGIRGPLTACSNCGAARDANVKFYLPDGAAEVAEEAALAAARAGADWTCGFCGAENKAGTTKCDRCGGTSDGTEGRRGPAHVAQVAAVHNAPTQVHPTVPARRIGKGGLIGLLLVVGVIAAALYFFVFRTHEAMVEVTAHHWARTIDVEELKWVTDQAWEGEVPAGARVLSSSEEVFKKEKTQTGSQRVKTGTRDLGNGHFEDVFEDRPIYTEREIRKLRVRYEAERWVKSRMAEAKGDDLNPSWPDPALGPKEREAVRKQVLSVGLRTPEGEVIEYPLDDEARWKAFTVGAKLKADIRASGGIAELQGPAERAQ